MSMDFSDFLEALDDNPFEETPIDVKTFVESVEWLNQPPLSEYQYTLVECMSQIYREEDLQRIMGKAAGSAHYERYTKTEIIQKLGKGSGKDHSSTIAVAYVVYKLLCLKDPARYYGKPPGDAIDIINIAINADQAKNVFFDGFVRKIKGCKWFAGKYSEKTNSMSFNKAITVYSGHSERESHEGLNIFIAILDEISGFIQKSISNSNEQAKTSENIYLAFRGTVDSRFPDYGKVVMLSFPRYDGDFISKAYDEAVADKETIVRSHRFIINEDLPHDDPDNYLDIEWDEDHIISYKLEGVFALCRPTWDMNPTRPIDNFKNAFLRNKPDAMMRFACKPGKGTETFFRQPDKIEKALSIRNPIDDAKRLDFNFQPDPNKTYFVHADLAQQVDKCAVAISHVEKWVTVRTFLDHEQIVPFVVTDAIVWWNPQVDGPVDLTVVKDWIVNLRRQGFNLGLVTFDRWNSFAIQQELKAIGIKTETLSVAKKHYEDLAMMFYDERLIAPHIDILLDELLKLKVIKNKVDHPDNASKDLSDALAGSVYNAISRSHRTDGDEIEVHSYGTYTKQQRELEAEEAKIEIPEDIAEFLSGFGLL